MSLSRSKIIRKGMLEPATFTLEPLGPALPEISTADEVFRPFPLGRSEVPQVEAEEVAVVEEIPPGIPEEEALRMAREAHAEGLREGRAQAEAELSSVCEALGKALLATGSLRPQLLHEAEDDLLKLSVLIAKKIMLREFACDPGIMAGVVQAAVEMACDEGNVVVRLNPAEYLVAVECVEFKELLREHPGINLKPDAAVGRAGCLVETARGNIDAGVEAQLDEILRRLVEEKSEHREEVDD
jgi:flagellar assembly protein FliH